MLFGFTLTVVSSVIGVAAGAGQGFYGGLTDRVVQRFIEIWTSIPSLYLLLIISSVLVPGFFVLLGILLLFSWVSLVGLVRAEFLRGRNFEYIQAARALGVSNPVIIFRHLLPNAMVATMTFLPFILSSSVMTLTALDFLGFGLPPGSPSLGEMLQQGKANVQAPWLGLTGFFSIAIMLSLLIFIGEAVRDAFIANFTERGEPGGAVCIALDGEPVVDLWGGYANIAGTKPWARNTLVNVFSVGKALCTLAAARIVEQGLIDLDAPVARVWPEFAQAEKAWITFRQLLCHQAGLPAIAEPLPDGAALEWAVMIHALERQKPWWAPGTAFGYHVNTYGFLVGEVVRRVAGKTLGRLIREEVAVPLGADIHIGLALEDHGRVAQYRWPETSTMQPPPEGAQAARADLEPEPALAKVENCWVTFLAPQCGHWGGVRLLPSTNFSKVFPHFEQVYSKIGIRVAGHSSSQGSQR